MEELFDAVVTNSKFLYSSFYGYTNQNVIDFFEDAGVPVKIERGNRVFPISDHSSDVIRALEREMKKVGVKVCLNTEVKSVEAEKGKFNKVVLKDTTTQTADACIVATGGLSYRSTGSTGDGFRFAENVGHKVTQCFPSLVPMETKEPWICELQGLSLRNVEAKILDGKKELYKDFGEMLFTHFGVSGPMILSASAHLEPTQMQDYVLHLDFKPALDAKALDIRIQSDFSKNANRDFANALDALLPRLLIPAIIRRSKIPPHSKVHQITKQQRLALCGILKDYTLHPYGMRPIAEAIVTRGGVSTIEVNPRTMASKCCAGLFFAGELLDIDAYTGGFNLQLCFATAFAAARGVAKFISAKSDVSERI